MKELTQQQKNEIESTSMSYGKAYDQNLYRYAAEEGASLVFPRVTQLEEGLKTAIGALEELRERHGSAWIGDMIRSLRTVLGAEEENPSDWFVYQNWETETLYASGLTLEEAHEAQDELNRLIEGGGHGDGSACCGRLSCKNDRYVAERLGLIQE